MTTTKLASERPGLAGRIELVNPATQLTIALNVRTDTKIDPDFVASIKELGILQPPMVTLNDQGGYDVVLGQRRTLAAVQAGLTTIPVYVVDKNEADAARVIDQLTENDQRQQISAAERAGGYRQLALFGLTPEQIAKRTATPKGTVETALAVAGNETALKVLTDHQVTLEQAAAMIDFDGDKAAVKILTEALENEPGRFDYKVADLTKRRELKRHREALHRQLQEEGVTRLADAEHSAYDDKERPNAKRLTRFGTKEDPKTPLTPEKVRADNPEQLAGRVVKNWNKPGDTYGEWASIEYMILDPETAGYPELDNAPAPRQLTDEEKAQEAERDARRAADDQRRADLKTAEQVRTEWITTLLNKPKLPDWQALATALLGRSEIGVDRDTLTLLGIEPAGNDWQANKAAVRATAAAATTPAARARFIAAAVISQAEETVNYAYDADGYTIRITYLETLTSWGYTLSPVEMTLLEDAQQSLAELAGADDGGVDDEFEEGNDE